MSLAEKLRAALAAPASQRPIAGDLIGEEQSAAVPAAVLVAVTDRPAPGVILTVRRDHLRTHAGQIAFPGGRIDPGEDPIAAALREAEEEVALDPKSAEVIAPLDPYRTVTGYAVTPVIAVIPPDLALTPHDLEVADWFEAPLGHLLDPSRHKLEAAMFHGQQRHYYVIQWDERRIWGATAAMLVNLSRRLRWA